MTNYHELHLQLFYECKKSVKSFVTETVEAKTIGYKSFN